MRGDRVSVAAQGDLRRSRAAAVVGNPGRRQAPEPTRRLVQDGRPDGAGEYGERPRRSSRHASMTPRSAARSATRSTDRAAGARPRMDGSRTAAPVPHLERGGAAGMSATGRCIACARGIDAARLPRVRIGPRGRPRPSPHPPRRRPRRHRRLRARRGCDARRRPAPGGGPPAPARVRRQRRVRRPSARPTARGKPVDVFVGIFEGESISWYPGARGGLTRSMVFPIGRAARRPLSDPGPAGGLPRASVRAGMAGSRPIFQPRLGHLGIRRHQGHGCLADRGRFAAATRAQRSMNGVDPDAGGPCADHRRLGQ